MNPATLILCLFVYALSKSQVGSQSSLALTIYNDGFALVKDTRQFSFEQGKSNLYFTDVASSIQSETVTFKPKSNSSSIKIAQQTFQNNLITKIGLYKKYINKNVTVLFNTNQNGTATVKGKLLNVDQDKLIIEEYGKQVISLESSTAVTLQSLPEDFFTTPTLNWLVYSSSNISTKCQIAYRATGFSWKSDYILTLNGKEDQADLNGWVSIENQSGKRYANASLKLIAGEINRISQGNFTQLEQEDYSEKLLGGQLPPQFSQKSFSDYHMYTLSQKVDLTAQSTKQLEFIPRINKIPIDRFYQIDVNTGGRQQLNLQAQSLVDFLNSKQVHSKLGIPLPKGIVRVFKNDQADNSLQFIGQDQIQHSPKNEKVMLSIGSAFDLVANVRVVSKKTRENYAFDAEMQMKISNHGTNKKKILVKIHSYYGSNMSVSIKNIQVKLLKESSQLYKFWFQIQKDQELSFKWIQSFSGY